MFKKERKPREKILARRVEIGENDIVIVYTYVAMRHMSDNPCLSSRSIWITFCNKEPLTLALP